MRKWILTLSAVMAVATIGFLPRTASAHRDGCHRWHSCASDTGSYVCGDLGYTSECGGGVVTTTTTSSVGSSPPRSATDDVVAEPLDFTPPPRPSVTTPTVSGRRVTLTVSAEARSTITVYQGSVVVAETKVIRVPQSISFNLVDGHHTLSLRAFDAAGNRSDAADVKVDVDGTPPPTAEVNAAPGTWQDPFTTITIRGENGTSYVLTVDDRPPQKGSLSSGWAGETIALGNGSHQATVILSDGAGNASSPVTVPITVDIPAPVIATFKLTNRPGRTPSVELDGPPRAKGVVRLLGEQPAERHFELDSTGSATAEFTTEDGTYRLVAELTDVQGRAAPPAELADVVVDTIAPSLSARADRSAAKHGDFGLVITAEAGSKVRVDGPSDFDFSYTSTGQPVRRKTDIAGGSHEARVVVTDPYGNRTVRIVTATVAWTAGEIAAGVVVMVLILAVFVWQRRRLARLARWLAHVVLDGLRRFTAWRVQQRFLRAQAAARVEYERDVVRFREAQRRWIDRQEKLARRLVIAQTFDGHSSDTSAVKLKRGERVLWTNGCALVEPRRRQGVEMPETIDGGRVTVTNRRAVFQGSSRSKEWTFGKLIGIHYHPEMVQIEVSNRQRTAGFTYGTVDGDEVRFWLDLAVAHYTSTVGQYVALLEEERNDHATSEPVEPAVPGILQTGAPTGMSPNGLQTSEPDDEPVGVVAVTGAGSPTR